MHATLLMDVGGTHTRCRIIEYNNLTHTVPHKTTSFSKRIDTRDGLFDFINGLLSAYRLQNRLANAVLCFAGPVTDHSQVYMTNWTGNRHVLFSDLITCGLRADRTTILNDMEAAAHGLIHCKANGGNRDIVPLYQPVGIVIPEVGNSLLLMPGTGTGVATILTQAKPGRPAGSLVLTCETQHSAMPTLDSGNDKLLQEARRILGKNCLTWEDVISGRGLELIYQSLGRLDGHNPDQINRTNWLDAATIAARAVEGTDERCDIALDVYYRYAGALMQMLALTVRPNKGIYLAGNSTRNNLSYIPFSGFISALHDNDICRAMLEDFPVYMVLADLNLDGAAWLAERFRYSTIQTSLFD